MARLSPETYQSHRGLPTLAGLATFVEAARPGLSVEACVTRLKRYHYAFRRLHEIFTARITAEPIYELKTGFSHHAYSVQEHVEAIRARVGEMREPPLGLEAVPDPALEILFDEILSSPSTIELIVGLYEVALPGVLDAGARATYRGDESAHRRALGRLCRFARLELTDMIAFGRDCIKCLVEPASRKSLTAGTTLLGRALASAGGVDGSLPREGETPPRSQSATPYRFEPVPRRDPRFQDLFNQGVNPESFLYRPAYPARSKTLMMLFKRLREIDVPEMMASIICIETTKWKALGLLSRHVAAALGRSAARHDGRGRLRRQRRRLDARPGSPTTGRCVSTPNARRLERHAVLHHFIEQGLMTKTGKRFEWEVGVESGDPLLATIQDYDWADEVLHASIGRDWYIPQVGHWKEALEYGDKCWSKILSNWTTVRDQGLTTHENWWPGVYRQACESWGVDPDPEVLAFSETYETQRADLKTVSVSG